MRYAVLLAAGLVAAAGCGKVPGGGDKAEPAKGGDADEGLPKSTNPLRFTAWQLIQHYSDQKGKPKPEPHPQEGKRIVIEMGWPYGVQPADRQFLLLNGSDNLFRRPQAVAVLKNNRGFTKGEWERRGMCYVEGRVRGTVGFESRPWSKEWTKLTGNGLGEWFVLIDDAEIVARPD